jgi:hypothetical protein
MSITYAISREERIIRASATGIIRAGDLHELVQALLADPALQPGMRGIYDSRFGEPDITVLQLAEVAGEVRQLLKRGLGRIALVAASQTTYRVEQTFAVLARALGVDVNVFLELEKAEAWIHENGNGGSSRESNLAT